MWTRSTMYFGVKVPNQSMKTRWMMKPEEVLNLPTPISPSNRALKLQYIIILHMGLHVNPSNVVFSYLLKQANGGTSKIDIGSCILIHTSVKFHFSQQIFSDIQLWHAFLQLNSLCPSTPQFTTLWLQWKRSRQFSLNRTFHYHRVKNLPLTCIYCSDVSNFGWCWCHWIIRMRRVVRISANSRMAWKFEKTIQMLPSCNMYACNYLVG